MLTLKSIVKDYVTGDTVVSALKGINIEFRKNEFVSILGPSGCGKTTILSLIAGLIKPTAGHITVDNKQPNVKDDMCVYMFQRDNLLPWRTIEKNIYFGCCCVYFGGHFRDRYLAIKYIK